MRDPRGDDIDRVPVPAPVLGHRLGNGGAATIFAARWQGREVSAKVAHAADRDVAGDLAVEAEVLGRVSHPALLEVLAAGQLADGRPYLVLPLLRGEDLAARLGRGPLPLASALAVVTAVGGALTALHAAGVVHRDLKPENVFLGERGVFLLDLGLARSIATGTASSRIRGTYDVMAPERLYGEPAGVATEVYELAALAWAALTGALPWRPGVAPSARRGIPPLVLDGAPGAASAALDAVLRAALSTVPERRPASIEDLVAALHTAARDPGPAAAGRRRTLEMRAVLPAARTTAPLPAQSPATGMAAANGSASSSSWLEAATSTTARAQGMLVSTAAQGPAPGAGAGTGSGSNASSASGAAGASSAAAWEGPTTALVPAAGGPEAVPAPGSVIAETYRLLGVLGSGGAGTVFAAEHLRLPRRLAIKVLRPDRGDRDARVRFRREAEIIASLSHPHIVEVFDYDVDDSGAPFMVMELLEGETLRDRLRRGPLPVADVVELIRQVASAVSAAHARGVVHRDLKPSNLFLRTSASGALDVRVLDFGISKVLGDPGDDTTSGLMLGSPGYAAPEQSRGDAAALGPVTDVFALAAIAYEALSGHRAFAAPTREAVVLRILHGEPDPLRSHGASRALAAVVHAGLARRPERRPPSAEAFATALAAAAIGRATQPQRLRRLALAASVLAVLGAALQIALQPRSGGDAALAAALTVDPAAPEWSGASVRPPDRAAPGAEASAAVRPPDSARDAATVRGSDGEHATQERASGSASIAPESAVAPRDRAATVAESAGAPTDRAVPPGSRTDDPSRARGVRTRARPSASTRPGTRSGASGSSPEPARPVEPVRQPGTRPDLPRLRDLLEK